MTVAFIVNYFLYPTMQMRIQLLQIPVYVGSENNLVVENTNDGFHGTDGFNDAVFEHTPDMDKIKRNEMAHQAIIRLAKEYPSRIII